MTVALGSWDHAARLATAELLRRGWSRLTALVGGHVASFGDVCYQTDQRLREVLRRPDGRLYHRESIGRVRRQLRDSGIIKSERIYVGAVLPNAKLAAQGKLLRSSRGTTLKTFNWRAVEQKNPFNRRERRQLRQQQARETRAAGDAVLPRPRHTAVRAIVDPVQFPAVHDIDILDVVNRARAAHERRAELEQKRSQTAARVTAPERPPPE